MAQIQGTQTASGGRLDGSVGTALTATDSAIAIGVGWGGTATYAVRAGSTDQRGAVTITASATTPAQATATVTLTFKDGAFASTPAAFFVQLGNSSSAVNDAQPTAVACTATALSWCSGVLPVATKTYLFQWCVIA